MVLGTAEFARLGYDIKTASEYADAATVYQSVGDGIESATEASQSIISTLKAFGEETLSAMDVVDKFNEVGNNFAISSKGVGDALQRSAAALTAAGNTVDESIGMIVAANAVQQNPEQVGTALKTLAMRLRSTKVELEEAGEETDNAANSISELRSRLLALTGVDIQLDENTYKSSYQIIQEMSQVWDTIEDIDQAAALKLMGGVRQANVLAGMIDNFDLAEQALQTSMDSSGSAMRENEKVLESIEGKINIFKASWQELSSAVVDSDLVKFFVDLGTAITQALSFSTDNIGALPTIAGVAGLAALVKNIGLTHNDRVTIGLSIFKEAA